MSFTTAVLTGDRVLVRGTDSQGTENETVLDGSQWFEVTKTDTYSQAQADFDSAVEAFFAPLTDAAEEFGRAMTRPTDSIGYVVLQEEVPATPGQREHLVRLSHDSQVLRLISEDNTDRLIWVGDSLEIIQLDDDALAAQV